MKFQKFHMIHNKGRMSTEDFNKKLLEIADDEHRDLDGDVIFVYKGSKIRKYFVHVMHNIVVDCGVYTPPKSMRRS